MLPVFELVFVSDDAVAVFAPPASDEPFTAVWGAWCRDLKNDVAVRPYSRKTASTRLSAITLGTTTFERAYTRRVAPLPSSLYLSVRAVRYRGTPAVENDAAVSSLARETAAFPPCVQGGGRLCEHARHDARHSCSDCAAMIFCTLMNCGWGSRRHTFDSLALRRD